jgi:hypothetical protein
MDDTVVAVRITRETKPDKNFIFETCGYYGKAEGVTKSICEQFPSQARKILKCAAQRGEKESRPSH